MSDFWIGNALLAAAVVLAAGSHTLMKTVIDKTRLTAFNWEMIQTLCSAENILRGGAAMVGIVAGFLCWILCLRKLDLSYAYPIACSSVLLVTLLSLLFLKETVTLRVWLGTAMIVVGIILLTPTK